MLPLVVVALVGDEKNAVELPGCLWARPSPAVTIVGVGAKAARVAAGLKEVVPVPVKSAKKRQEAIVRAGSMEGGGIGGASPSMKKQNAVREKKLFETRHDWFWRGWG